MLLGRQPIFDAHRRVLGYELRYRDPCGGPCRPGADETSRRSSEPGGDLGGIAVVVGGHLAFLKASAALLTSDLALPFPESQVVIEVAANMLLDDDLLAGCHSLVEQGYTLALDDVRSALEGRPLAPLCEVATVDLQGAQDLEAVVEHLRACGLRLIARGVETFGQFQRARDLGFEGFQGFLPRAAELAPRALSPTQASCLRLAARLDDADLSVSETEAIVRTDAALAYRVLRLASLGTAHGMRSQVGTLRQAIILFGQRRLASLVALALLSATSDGEEELEQLRCAAIRARTAELLAGTEGCAGEAFLVGLLSSLEEVLHTPVALALEAFPVSEAIRSAVLGHQGPLGVILAAVVDHEREGDRLGDGAIAPEQIERAYLDAVAWASALDTPKAAATTPAAP